MINERAVCILLECILVLVKSSLHAVRFNPCEVRLNHKYDCSLLDICYYCQ